MKLAPVAAVAAALVLGGECDRRLAAVALHPELRQTFPHLPFD